MNDKLLANRYKVLEKLGEGGMGIVWKVYDTVENREIALKQFLRAGISKELTLSEGAVAMVGVAGKTEAGGARKTIAKDVVKIVGGIGAVAKAGLDPFTTITSRFTLSTGQIQRVIVTATEETKDEESLRFKQEFRTMVKLQHPNTVHVYDYGKLENGDNYLTMEIVSGEELRDILKQRQLELEETYRILIQFAQVINFIHSRLLIHRDIKPDNIRVLPDGNIKVMDFGLMDQMGLPSNGEITGTPLYLPPEVAKGGIIDARSDLYSLGIMAYELTTGKLPFLGKTILEIIKKHIEKPPTPPRKIREDIPEELEKIILRLIAKDQSDRYQSAAELINDLVRIGAEEVSVETLEQRKSYLNCSELIGREGEMRELKELFRLTKESKGQSVFVAAPAGTGKSRLIQEFRLLVQLDEVPFTQGNCFEQGMTAYQPVAEALKPLLPLTSKNVIDKYGSVLVKVLPELKNKGYEPASQLEEYAEKARLFESVTGWLKEVSEVQPLIIYIEDLHWSDTPSIDLINACIRELREYPIMILCSFRDDEVEPTSRIFQTVEENLTHEMKLLPLDSENVGILIAKMLGRIELTEDFTEHIYTATGGNPFFVSEIMRALIEEEQLKLERGSWILPADISALKLPTSIEATILRRLKLISPEALKIARIAAVVARNLDLSFLKTLSGLGDEEVFDILDELIERQFMKTEEKQYVFTHDHVRETLYAQLEEETRKEMHEKVGTIIEKRFTDNKEPVINELAYHFSRSLNKTKAMTYLIQVGDSQQKTNDFVRATKSWTEALEILNIIDYPNKKTVIANLRDRLMETSYSADPGLCMRVCEKQFKELNSLGDILGIVKKFNFIFRIVDIIMPKKLALKIKIKLSKQPPKEKIEGDFRTIITFILRSQGYGAISACFSGSPKEGLQFIKQGDRYLPDLNGLSFSYVTAGYFPVYQYLGKLDSYSPRLTKAFNIMRTMDKYGYLEKRFDKYVYAVLMYHIIESSVWVGENYDREFYERALRYCEKERFVDLQYYLLITNLELLSFKGMYTAFREKISEAKDLLRRLGKPTTPEIYLYYNVAALNCLLFDYEEAKESVEKLYELAKSANYVYFLYGAEIYKSLLVFQQGKREEGISQLKEVISNIAKEKLFCHAEAMTCLAEMYLDINEIEQAQLVISQAKEFMEENFETPHLFFKAKLLLHNSEILRRKKEFEKAEDQLQEVMGLSQRLDNPLIKAWVFEQKAKIDVDLTKISSAKNNLNEAKQIFEKLGADRRRRKVSDELGSL